MKRAVQWEWLFVWLVVGGMGMAEVRTPEVAGQFYPAEADELQEMVDQYLTAVTEPSLEGELVAVVSPHAGYIYSGSVSAYSFRALKTVSFSTAVVVGTAHYFPTSNAAIFDGEAYQTPLGNVTVDKEFIKALLKASSLFASNPKAHKREHSIETQTPFLQRIAPKAQIVPIIIGTPNFETCQRIGEVIAEVIQQQANNKKIILIASSDLAHYPSREDARLVDTATLEAMLTLEPSYFSEVNSQWMRKGIPDLVCTYCGQGAVTVVMVAAKALGANRAQLLHYATSADVPYGEESRVVGYAAVAFVQSSKNESERFAVSKETQKKLLQMARSAIEKGVGGERPQSFEYSKEDPELKQPAAVFVTIRKDGDLRGCIGGTEAQMPLGEAVQYFAAASAFNDPRFPPVAQEELNKTNIEISILSPLKRVGSSSEIIPAVNGVVVKRGFRSGLFLPQVWIETGWTKEVFLDQLCTQKSGLPAGCWQDPQTELYTFTVFSFEETHSVM